MKSPPASNPASDAARILGRIRSPKKAKASKRNGSRGGRGKRREA